MNALYICYQSVREPLTRTQVVPYLEGLARAGHGMTLLTYEPVAPDAADAAELTRQLSARGIAWHWLRYHKRPTLPATAFDIANGVRVGLRLVRRHGIDVVHARSHVGAAIARQIRQLTRVKMVFDFRGFLAEEYVAAGVWPAGGRLFRLTKRMERALMRAADGYVVLTRRAAEQLRATYAAEMRDKPLAVIPCCVDLRLFQSRNGNGAVRSNSIVYVGKLGGIYATREMAAFVNAARAVMPELRWQIWTQTDPTAVHALLGDTAQAPHVSIGTLPPEQLAHELPNGVAALAFYQPGPANVACSPTKIGEYLAAGLPIVSHAGLGDVDELVNDARGPVGVIVDGYSDASLSDAAQRLAQLLRDPALAERCRTVARERFDLETVGWPAYQNLYRTLAHA